MKTNTFEHLSIATNNTIRVACFELCRRMLAGLKQVKAAVIAEYRSVLPGQEHMLELALNEAEALAWQTEFPQLFFPTLAVEKAAELASWQERQRQLRGDSAIITLAA